jgi:hypothetical protein
MSSALHEKLIASAAVNERSLSEEIEHILEEKFSEHDRVAERFGGVENLHVLTAIASSWRVIEMLSKKKWSEDVETLHAIKTATASVLDMIKPPVGALAQLGHELGYRYKGSVEAEKFARLSAVHAVKMAKGAEISPEFEGELIQSALDLRKSNPEQ